MLFRSARPPVTTAEPMLAGLTALVAQQPPVTPAPPATAVAAPPSTSIAPVERPLVGVRTIEDMVAELLRPMLREWLEANMPRMVEKALRIELAEGLKTINQMPGQAPGQPPRKAAE